MKSFVLLIVVGLSLLASGCITGVKNTIHKWSAPDLAFKRADVLPAATEFINVAESSKKTATELRYRILNAAIERYNSLIDQLNVKWSQTENDIRQIQGTNVGIKEMSIANGIAIATLGAAAPEGNAPLIQGISAFNTGLNGLKEEFTAQGITLQVMLALQAEFAKEVIAAKAPINFPYLQSLITAATEKEWSDEMLKLGKGLNDLESAILLSGRKKTVDIQLK